MKWFFRLPLLARVPLLAAAMIFIIALAMIQIAVLNLSRQYELQTERIGQVYLDGLSSAVLPAYQAHDQDGIRQALIQSLNVYLGVVDRQLALIDRENGILAHVSGPNLDNPTSPPDAIFHTPKGYAYEGESRSLWVWRELGSTGIVAANLDIAAFAKERSLLQLRLLLIGAVLSILSALGGYMVIRRVQRPLSTLSDHISRAVAFGPQKIDELDIPASDKDAYRLAHAYNQMVEAVQDREQLSEKLTKQNQQALLGRIAATLAHEIRNPLTGIMTALQTIRMYGNDAASRREALDFIDRGIQSLQSVAKAALSTYRPDAMGPALQATDLHDVILLVEPHAARKEIRCLSDIQLDSSVPLDAFKVRQIILNLLLNAIQTTPQGGAVALLSRYTDNALNITVNDQGSGLPEHAQRILTADEPLQNDWSLGLESIRRLTREMNGRISVRNSDMGGSSIELTFVFTRDHLT